MQTVVCDAEVMFEAIRSSAADGLGTAKLKRGHKTVVDYMNER